jgi:hypothetical protein
MLITMPRILHELQLWQAIRRDSRRSPEQRTTQPCSLRYAHEAAGKLCYRCPHPSRDRIAGPVSGSEFSSIAPHLRPHAALDLYRGVEPRVEVDRSRAFAASVSRDRFDTAREASGASSPDCRQQCLEIMPKVLVGMPGPVRVQRAPLAGPVPKRWVSSSRICRVTTVLSRRRLALNRYVALTPTSPSHIGFPIPALFVASNCVIKRTISLGGWWKAVPGRS